MKTWVKVSQSYKEEDKEIKTVNILATKMYLKTKTKMKKSLKRISKRSVTTC